MTTMKPTFSKVRKSAEKAPPRPVSSFRFPAITQAQLDAEILFRKAQGEELTTTDLLVECVRGYLRNSPSAEVAIEMAAKRDPSVKAVLDLTRKTDAAAPGGSQISSSRGKSDSAHSAQDKVAALVQQLKKNVREGA